MADGGGPVHVGDGDDALLAELSDPMHPPSDRGCLSIALATGRLVHVVGEIHCCFRCLVPPNPRDDNIDHTETSTGTRESSDADSRKASTKACAGPLVCIGISGSASEGRPCLVRLAPVSPSSVQKWHAHLVLAYLPAEIGWYEEFWGGFWDLVLFPHPEVRRLAPGPPLPMSASENLGFSREL